MSGGSLGELHRKRIASIFLVLTLLFSGCLRNRPQATAQAISSKISFERSFLLWKLEDGMTVQPMVEACSKKHVRLELTSLCAEIARGRKVETEVAKGYLFLLYRQKAPSFLAFSEAPVSLASKDGPEFEVAFFEQMIQLDNEAVKNAENCISQASQAEILNFCRLLERSRRAELQLLQIKLCQGQENCGYTPSGPVSQTLDFGSCDDSFSSKDSLQFSLVGQIRPDGLETRQRVYSAPGCGLQSRKSSSSRSTEYAGEDTSTPFFSDPDRLASMRKG